MTPTINKKISHNLEIDPDFIGKVCLKKRDSTSNLEIHSIMTMQLI